MKDKCNHGDIGMVVDHEKKPGIVIVTLDLH